MSRSGEVKSIDCTSCGAGLEILGGGRVTTHVCPYCGAMLDALENYRVLEKFSTLGRPASPFAIGQSGEVGGVRWQIIGTLGMRETAGTGTWYWTEHLLYSPTHGYTWLTVENGHLIWTRRYRKRVSPAWISTAQVEAAETPPRCHSGGESYRYYETSVAEIVFAEGEFTWCPKKGDRTTTVSMLSDLSMIDYVASASEREIERSTYLARAETLAAFGVEVEEGPTGVHPLQPFVPGPNDRFLARLGTGFAALCLVLGLYMSGSGHQILAETRLLAAELPAEIPLEIDAAGRLVQLRLFGDRRQNWAWIGIELTDPEDQPVFVSGAEISYYSGYDDGAWSENNETAYFSFRAPTAGTYTLGLDVEEAGVDEVANAATAEARSDFGFGNDGRGSGLYLFILAGAFALVAGWFAARRPLHEKLRWRGSDWEDDDDDDMTAERRAA